MKLFSKKWRFILIVAVVVATSGFVLEHFISFNPISVVVNTIASPIKTGFSYIAHSITDCRDFIWDMRAYKEENERLVAENTALKMQNRDVASYMEENERLLALLGLQESITDYTTVAAKVISYSGNNWYEQIEINKGAINGRNPGNAVITPERIVGKVVETGPNYSIVTTILDPDSDIGIRVARTGGSGIVEGDSELVKDGNCKLSFLDRDTPLIVGDIVRTSGTGGVYPPGLPVGSVMNVSADSMGNLKYALISPSVDFDKLNEVLVINGIKTQ